MANVNVNHATRTIQTAQPTVRIEPTVVIKLKLR